MTEPPTLCRCTFQSGAYELSYYVEGRLTYKEVGSWRIHEEAGLAMVTFLVEWVQVTPGIHYRAPGTSYAYELSVVGGRLELRDEEAILSYERCPDI